MDMLMNILALSAEDGEARLQARGKSIVRVSKARAVMMEKLEHGITCVASIPFHMTACSKDGLLILDGRAPSIKESLRDGVHSNCQVYLDGWNEGPRDGRGRYLNPVEQFARVDWLEALTDNDRPRAVFSLRDEAAVAAELALRVAVDPAEVRFDIAEELLASRLPELQEGDMSLLPPVLNRLERPIYLKVARPGVVTKVTPTAVTVRDTERKYWTYPVPEGMEIGRGVAQGMSVSRGRPLFCLAVTMEGLSKLRLAEILVNTVRERMWISDRGRKLLRLSYATAVAHYCLKCGAEAGVFPLGEDRHCAACKAAAVPALRKAYAICNGRHYLVAAGAAGARLPRPAELSHVRGWMRRLANGEVSVAEKRIQQPAFTHVA